MVGWASFLSSNNGEPKASGGVLLEVPPSFDGRARISQDPQLKNPDRHRLRFGLEG